MFTLPQSDGPVEGSSDDHPLVLESIEAEEFLSFLRVMFRPHYGPTWEETRTLSLEQWVFVLKLTTMWSFNRLRRAAIDNLTPLLAAGDPVRWVSLARQYNVHEWLFPALHALARRAEPLRLHEVKPLGIVTVVKIAEVRESYTGWQSATTYHGNNKGYTSRGTYDFESIIQRVFREELKAT